MDKDVIPKTDAGLNTLLQLMKLNLPTHAAALGITAGEVSQTERDADTVGLLIPFASAVNAFKEEVVGFKDLIIRGETNSPTPSLPVLNVPDASEVTFTVGIVKRLRLLIRKIKASPNYTEAIGRDLGIVRTSDPISPENVKPTIDLAAASSGYLFSIVVSGRGQSQSWDVLYQRDGETNWEKATTATGKSVDAAITPTVAGKPERIKVRVQLKKSNQNYGQSSDISEITLNP